MILRGLTQGKETFYSGGSAGDLHSTSLIFYGP